MSDAVQESISADLPLTHPEHDRLGYAPFAARLADAIEALAPDQAMVLAVHGPWGSGKTTLLNFVSHHLQSDPRGETIVSHFNPWRLSPHDDLAVRLIDQLRAHVVPDGDARLSAVLADLAVLLAGERPVTPSRRAHSDLPLDLESARGAAAQELRGAPRAVVLVDDVDRLDARQLTELFRAVRGVADFPNVVYLLAFDDGIARRTLSEAYGIDGGQYLEKMVQTAFQIPDLDRSLLRELFFESIDRVMMAEEQAGRLDIRYWGNVYWDGLDHFIVTPRHVKRLTNALAIAYPGIAGEVNVVDLIVIEALRMFVPDVYETIRAHPYRFTGTSPAVRSANEARRARANKAFHQEWIEHVPSVDRDAVKRLVLRVFPRLAGVWDSTGFGPESERAWRREARVAAGECFPVYFRFSVLPGRVSRREFEALLRSADERAPLDDHLAEILGADPSRKQDRARSLLEQIMDLDVADMKASHAGRLFGVLLDRGDDVLRLDTTPVGSFEFELSTLLGRALRYLLQRVDETERVGLMLRCVEETPAIATPAVLLDSVLEDVRVGSRSAVVPDPEAHVRLEAASVERIREGARNGALVDAPLLPMLLRRWANMSGADAVRAWCTRVTRDDAVLRQLVVAFARKELRAGPEDVAAVATTVIDGAELARYVDRPDLAEWASDQLASGAGSSPGREALGALVSSSAGE